jgi:hypothetical protein
LQLFAELLQFLWKLLGIRREKVILDVVESLEPECGNLIQHCAFAGDRIGKDNVKCGNPIRYDKEQCRTKVEDFAHLAAAQFLNSAKID